jgi:HEAT repeat protein
MMANNLQDLLADLASGDDERAEAAVPPLAAHPEAIPALEPYLRSPESDLRWWAVRTLAQMEKPPKDWLLKALGDDSEEVRQCATLALAHHPTEDAIPGLLRLVTDPETVTANLAASALAAIGASAIPGLLDLLATSSHVSSVEIIRALASIGDPRAIPALMEAMQQDSPAMHYWAEQGLDRLGLGMVYIKPE